MRLPDTTLAWALSAFLAFIGTARAACPNDCPDSMKPLLAGNNGTPDSFAQRRAGAEADATWKIGVTNRGVFRIRQSDLVAAGADSSCLVGDDIRIYCRTQEIAVSVTSAGLWSTNDYVAFFGLGLDGAYTVTNAYWLGLLPGGRRMATRDGAPLAGAPLVTSYCERVRYAPQNLYRAYYRPLDESYDHWFAALILGGVWATYPNAISAPIGGSTGIVRVTVDGAAQDTNVTPDHLTRIYINVGPGNTNNLFLTNLFYDGTARATSTLAISSSMITDHSTTVGVEQITLSGMTSNSAGAYLENYELHYPRQLLVLSNALAFGGEASSNTYRIDGFSVSNGNAVLDVTDVFAPVLLTNVLVQPTTNGFALKFGDTVSSSACYFAAATGAYKSVASLERVVFRNLAATNRQADYIAVGPYAFRTNAYKLLKYRASHGLTVAIAPLSDIYNEFGYGITDAEAIKQFVGYAFHHWAGPVPRYLVLLGDGTSDPKANLGPNTANNWVPVKLRPTPFAWMAQDNWYAEVNGTNDNLIDMSVGRIPASNDTALGYVVDKMITYEALSSTNAWHKRATVVADTTVNGFNFKTSTLNFVVNRLQTGGFTTVTQLYKDDQAGTNINSTLKANINVSGRFLVNYMGHGSEQDWSSLPALWQNQDQAGLTNSIWPIVTVFTCKNGIFQSDTNAPCLAESYLMRQNRGAIAVIAPTELSLEQFAEKVADGFFQAFGSNHVARLGDSLNVGLSNLYFNGNSSAYELMGYEVFGDPALLAYPP